MRVTQHARRLSSAHRRVGRIALVLAVGALLAACGNNTPVGESPTFKGTYLEHALVTNPNGGGPMVERYGPPLNWNPSSRE